MKKILFWVIAVLITISAVIYQRKTGPTYNKKIEIEVSKAKYKLSLIRSIEIGSKTPVKLNITDKTINATLYYKRFQTNDAYTSTSFTFQEKKVDSYIMNKVFGIYAEKGWYALLPDQAMAGKLQYYLEIEDTSASKSYFKSKPIVVRYKGAVPSKILAPHIVFMFIAMLLGNLAGIMAIFNYPGYKKYTTLTLISLSIGGLIFGPWVQLFAFGELWAGIPFAWDLTDNKTLFSFVFWVLAYFSNRRKEKSIYTIIASIVMLVIYSIPHSMYGSELDPETGKIIQGWIQLF